MVRQLFSGNKEAGDYSYGWDGRDASGRPLGSGVYQFVLSVNHKTAVKRAVIVR
jgi:flagellar hook assembly protein FlgD